MYHPRAENLPKTYTALVLPSSTPLDQATEIRAAFDAARTGQGFPRITIMTGSDDPFRSMELMHMELGMAELDMELGMAELGGLMSEQVRTWS